MYLVQTGSVQDLHQNTLQVNLHFYPVRVLKCTNVISHVEILEKLDKSIGRDEISEAYDCIIK